MNAHKFAKWFGWILILIGVLGFIPGVTNADRLLGIFQVDTVHNIVHIITGILALWIGSTEGGARTYFKIFGVVYLVVTVLGFVMNGSILNLFMVNTADNILHLVITVVALIVGFSGNKKAPMMPSSPTAGTM